ncbi:hypothetical protein JIR001_16260 [Polycladomyces abyssicola]|uniref:Uncharacterized protein n=1 Tax=Polycladomyces abyssicola TaxID=1125966 RepID=A0A8D5ZP00_9BACL|nr:hypothetical protein [Polycladomyces abyssicola]BCU81843.1 hypothetical protein JIR001_16260 [Polycladomyces abyssicola]
MRRLPFLFLLILLAACSQAAPDASSKQSVEVRAAKDWQSVVGKQLAKEQYAFQLIVNGSGATVTMNGEQSGQDWTMQNEGKQIQVVKKGDHIHLSRSGTQETATPRQLGLMSPRDHLLWMQRVGGRVERIGTVKWQGKRTIVLQKDLNERQVGKILSKWMGTPPSDFAEIIGHHFDVRYRLWYVPKTHTLEQMVAEIRSDGHLRQTIRYVFHPVR